MKTELLKAKVEEVVRLGITHAKNDSQTLEGDGQGISKDQEGLVSLFWGVYMFSV